MSRTSAHIEDRDPFEICLVPSFAAAFLLLLITDSYPKTIQASLSTLFQLIWLGVYLIGSVLALLGIFWRRDSATGLVLEQVGMVGIAGGSLIYLVALIVTAPSAGLVIIACLVAITSASVWRYAQIQRAITRGIEEDGAGK